MQLRRSLATATAVLALTALSGCGIRGFDYATDREYTPGAGTNNRDGVVDILSTVVVSADEGSGTLITSLSNGDREEARTLTAVTGMTVETGGDTASPVTFADFEPVEVPPAGLVNFADPALDIVATGDFEAGNFLDLTFEFADGERVSLSVPVVPDDSGYWAGMDAS